MLAVGITVGEFVVTCPRNSSSSTESAWWRRGVCLAQEVEKGNLTPPLQKLHKAAQREPSQ